jgi:aryl-alcohol dehydrogenase-like predicted oxidoreductase
VAILDRFRRLGTCGLRVSPLSLGTMTFGPEWGWGTDKDECRRIFDAYVEAGGNFVDTANFYTGGTSETFLGEFMTGRRDTLVLATKYGFCMNPGDPNAGGTHRKNLVQSLDASLKRLRTDFVDLLWVHTWDFTVTIEEVMRGLDDVVRAGKAIYVGLSNPPAWVAARAQTMAELRNWTPLIGLQVEYSLVERSIEREILPMAKSLGVGIVPWSPLGGGVLTGKYARKASAGSLDESRRRDSNKGRLTDRNREIVAAAEAVAAETGHSAAQVAIRWAMQRPGVSSVILGARTLAQLQDNLQAATFELSGDQMTRLDGASAIEPSYPQRYLQSGAINRFLTGGATIE